MYNRTDLPKIKGAGREVIENWYFPVMAYNGTKLTVTYKDGLNTPIPSKTVKVLDKTAPKSPTVHTIKKTSKTVTGKTEAYATVQVKFGSRTSYNGKANKYGSFKISIKPQKAGTNVYVTAKDAANNTSKVTKTKVK